MSLPVEISPNPLLRSTVEIRFSINIDRAKLFSIVYPAFASQFPIFEENKVPKELRKISPEFRFAPDYILKNDDFSLSFSSNLVAFENISEYKYWRNYFPFIKGQLSTFFQLNIIEKISRIGVRYASLFEGKNRIDEVLNFMPGIPVDEYEQTFSLIRLDLKKRYYNFHVQLANNAQAIKGNKPISGAYIDIDGSFSGQQSPSSEIFMLIDELHTEGKKIFFEKLIKPSFLETLNPKYE